MSLRARCQKLRSDQAGYTLVEMLVAVFMLLVMLAAVVGVSTVLQRSEPQINERAGQIQSARVMMERLVRELRQSYSVRTASASELVFETWVRRLSCGGAAPPSGDTSPAIRCAVRYVCSAGACSRGEGVPGSTPAATTRPRRRPFRQRAIHRHPRR